MRRHRPDAPDRHHHSWLHFLHLSHSHHGSQHSSHHGSQQDGLDRSHHHHHRPHLHLGSWLRRRRHSSAEPRSASVEQLSARDTTSSHPNLQEAAVSAGRRLCARFCVCVCVCVCVCARALGCCTLRHIKLFLFLLFFLLFFSVCLFAVVLLIFLVCSCFHCLHH